MSYRERPYLKRKYRIWGESITDCDICLYSLSPSNTNSFWSKVVKIDVKTTICEGELDEGIYIKQYSGFEVKKNEHKLCHLKRPLYPLK